MFTIKLSKQDLTNLKIFLERVDLKGKEVLPYTMIVKAVNEAKEEEQPKKVGD